MDSSIGRLISILHRQAQIYMNHVLRDFNITSAEYSFLLTLYKGEGITQDKLSCYLHIDKAATARAIHSLEQKGYIRKDRDVNDRRCNKIYLTDHALEVKADLRDRILGWSRLLSEGIDSKTMDLVLSALEQMVEKVEQTDF